MKGSGMIFLFLFALGFALIVYAADYYQVNNGSNTDIDEHGTCKNVANNHASGLALFVPTKTSSEWSTFRSNLPAGVTVSGCCNWGLSSQQTPEPGLTTCSPEPPSGECTCGTANCQTQQFGSCSMGGAICTTHGDCADIGQGLCQNAWWIYSCS